ncbi:hypothetical protein KEM09_15630 [Carboxylicivirga mesophila]|uniref:Uncharacterized protein n=1 Tax=Carboxylicivirga mesophila TaxID=1166478 RepID=A0ABS5KCX4_9BACT|nr:hypothetical protein [Carboxylicivirga mesophila]MBS2212848.1 hypothetical protein [Carboxylicivirga mesophila]
MEIILTTLPHERDIENNRLKLSVFVSVKLNTPKDTTLSAFPDILAWPEKVMSTEYAFRLDDGTLIDAQLNTDQINAGLYKRILHPDIKVDDFKDDEDLMQKRIYSFPVKHVQDFIFKTMKEEAVVNPSRKVKPERFVDEVQLGAISQYKLQDEAVRAVAQKQVRSTKPVPFVARRQEEDVKIQQRVRSDRFKRFEAQMNPQSDFAELRQFHRVDKAIKTTPKLQLEKPRFEFHDVVATMNSYPQIMRKMAFVLDFTIATPDELPANSTLSLVPQNLELSEDYSLSIPATAYELTDTGFFVRDKVDSLFKQGFVKVNSGDFEVVQIDADGAALKTNNMAESKVQEIARFYEVKAEISRSKVLRPEILDEVEPPQEEGLPYMRSAGIAITKNGMAEHLFRRIEQNVQLKNEFKAVSVKPFDVKGVKVKNTQFQVKPFLVKLPSKALYSDDVVQGYRMDIAYENEPDKWYSLHWRQDVYQWFDESNNPHPIEGVVPDEGYIQLGLTEDPDEPDDVFVSETLARWEGWSLSVRKPGYAINESDDYELEQDETVKKDFVHKSKTLEAQKYAYDSELDFRIHAQSKTVVGTLPKLRFGRAYRLRIRTVDLAGNSVAHTVVTSDKSSSERTNIKYLRYEPLASPIVLVGNQLKDGEFLESMVIRSNYNQSVAEYEATHQVNGLKLDDHSLRFLLPPKNSQQMAECHGMFEKAFGDAQKAKEIYQIITAHEGLYQQDEKNKEKVYQPSEVEIIYLPDPMAAGVALFLADDCEHTHTQTFEPRLFSFFSKDEIRLGQTDEVEIPEDWYRSGYIRLRLEEGEYNTHWNPSTHQLTFYLPKGIRTRIRFSTFWRESDVKELSAIWQMVKDDATNNIDEARDLAFSGQHWMLSPSREMELVHAVQQPIDAPVIEELLPNRDFKTNHADINIRFDIHGESTEKVELQARWKEQWDDGISVTIKEREGSNSIPDIQINYHDDVVTKGTIPEPEKIELAPTQNIKVQPIKAYPLRSKAEFDAEPQPKARRINKDYQVQNVAFQKFQTDKSKARDSLVNRVKFDVQEYQFNFYKRLNLRFSPLKHQYGDTRHRWVDYRLLAASRYNEYFDKILTAHPELNTVRLSEWKEKVSIPSSARPKAPEIDYIIPTFEWRKTENETAMRHQRMGGGLRIFIKRPWFSSGDDEMLGVILPEKGYNPASLVSKGGYNADYTSWGMDPLLYSVQPTSYSPTVEDFYMNPVIDSDLQYPDKNQRAKVVAYPVHFDEERQVWFSDLRIDPKSMYFPFVKLILARYQPYSVRKDKEDVCLSSVVSANFNQLVPERQTTIHFNKADVNSKFTIKVEGAIYNERYAKYGNYNFIKISFQDTKYSRPIYGMVSDGNVDKQLQEETLIVRISSKQVTNNRYSITKEFKLPSKYKKEAYQIIIEEYERGPKQIPGLPQAYQNRLEQSEQTDRLIYADVFNINETEMTISG